MAADLFQKLSDGALKSAQAFFEKCVAKSKGKTLYSLAFCPDNDVQSVFLMANTEQGLSKQVDEFFRKNKKALAGHPVSREQIAESMRFEAPDWEFSDNKAAAVNAAFDTIWSDVDEESPTTRATRKKCLEALVKGLQAFDRDCLTPAVDRESFTLLVFIPDPDDVKEIKALAKQLNPAKAYRRFSKAYYPTE